MNPGDNDRIAARLREASTLLHDQGASAYRANAYRKAAEAVAASRRDVRRVFETEGVRGLDAIHGVGLGIASAIAEMLATGNWALLDRLRGEPAPPEQLRLEPVPRRDPVFPPAAELPPVEALLDVDREYRERNALGTLRRIAPRRFNPAHEAWLPILHTRRGPWHFTVLFSNTALAHKLQRTHDWVVIFFYDGDHVERQCTVVTETHGDLEGRRVVRGRETECRFHANPEEAVQ